jgi:hypothetical protein
MDKTQLVKSLALAYSPLLASLWAPQTDAFTAQKPVLQPPAGSLDRSVSRCSASPERPTRSTTVMPRGSEAQG